MGDTQHQGVVAHLKSERHYTEVDLDDLLKKTDKPALILILDGVQDPHNLGACLRTADAAGVDALIIPKDRSSPLTPTARKVACGAAETIPVITVSNLARTLDHLKEQGVWLIGAAADASDTVYDIDLTGPVGIVLGAEGHGLRRLTQERCDYLAHVPMTGSVESLNVSVATGIFLFEAVRQRRF